MIKKILLKSIDEHSRLTLSGDIEGLLGYYKTVFPVFVRGEAQLIKSRDELRAALNAASARSRAAGVTRIEGRLIKAHKISDRRYRCLVEWDYHTPKYSAPQTTAVMFFRVRSFVGIFRSTQKKAQKELDKPTRLFALTAPLGTQSSAGKLTPIREIKNDRLHLRH